MMVSPKGAPIPILGLELTELDDARAADPDDDDLSFEMVTNDQSTNVVVIQNENLGRKQDQSKRIRRRIFTRSLKVRRRPSMR
ncbi:unnamed protein product [Rotaria sp. Silwood1]|nr:unnamed protein product [Rotaria sp. Silwood1]